MSNLAACTSAVYDWLLHNCLALNPDKSEAAMYGTASRVQSLKGETVITVAGAPVKLSHSIKSTGVTIDENLTFDEHVRNVCKASYYHIRYLRHIRAALSKDTACLVASAIVGSRLDYCNTLLVGISEANLDKLEHVQNTLARIVTGTCRRDHISPVLPDLHWLSIRARITYKIAMLVFTMREVKQPMYIAKLIEDYKPARSTSRLLLKEPCVKNYQTEIISLCSCQDIEWSSRSH